MSWPSIMVAVLVAGWLLVGALVETLRELRLHAQRRATQQALREYHARRRAVGR